MIFSQLTKQTEIIRKEGFHMIKSKVFDDELSLLGFGLMRLPEKDGAPDEEVIRGMVDYAFAHGVNYFDTAWPYHSGKSEDVIGRILAGRPRDSFRLADKYPGHQIADSYNPAEIFEKQLSKCGVDYFDYYLLHNVYENDIDVYEDERWNIIPYFVEQRRLGRIRHLGFSSHGGLDILTRFLDKHGVDMEFCQIQLNYVDYTLQNAREKLELLDKYGIPVWVMEPVRGGKLCRLDSETEAKMKALRPDESIPAWAFRWLQSIPSVKMILSGMTTPDQMIDNVKTFEERRPLSEEETSLLMAAAEEMKKSVPCTACRYCTAGCPMELNIPFLISIYNDLRFAPVTNSAMRLDNLPAEKLPSACLQCGACAAICPQKIDIPSVLSDLDERLKTIPTWAGICEERLKITNKMLGKQ